MSKHVNTLRKNFSLLTKKYFFADKILSFILFLLLGIFRPDMVVLFAYAFTIVYLMLTHRTRLLAHLGLSSVLSLAWIVISKDQYGYNYAFMTVKGTNLFPVFAWAIGLFAVYVIYSHYAHFLRLSKTFQRFLLFTGIYIVLLLAVETVGYYVFGIQNLTAGAYEPLPICQCIHAPRWMQLAYILLGPIYFSFALLFKLERTPSETLM